MTVHDVHELPLEYGYCTDCENYDQTSSYCREHERNIGRGACNMGFRRKHKTNGDIIRQMTDEELAELFMGLGNCLDDVSDEQCAEFGDCQECWLYWIGTEAKKE